MFTFQMTFTGYNRVENRLRKGVASIPQTADKVVGEWAQGVRGKLRSEPYPSKRPGQKYVRTGRYKNSWAARRVSAGKWEIVNNARGPKGQAYPVFVGGDKSGGGQAWMHAGRHRKSRMIIDEEVPALREELRTAVIREFNE